ncbi:amino acid adenylation domain-containing protein [Chloroflexi bacterium TSY]|nr:amino acid adenylation domain-containing protein [Chloroflexi bacterium TSY]
MNTVPELLSQLRHHEIKIWLDNGQLRYSAPAHSLSSSLRLELVKRKEELIEFLQSTQISARSFTSSIQHVARDKKYFPLSFSQQRLWFLEKMEPNKSIYNDHLILLMRGVLDAEALKNSVNSIVARHEALRTRMPIIDDRPVQVIEPTLSLEIPIIDLQKLPSAQREAKASSFVLKEIQRPFSLEEGPLLRSRILKLAPDIHIFLLVKHHIITDGWSFGLLRQELNKLYIAYAHDLPLKLPRLPVQYVDFTMWQHQRLQGETLEQLLSYWKQKLDGAPPLLNLPMDYPRPATQSYRGSSKSRVFSPSLLQGLRQLSNQHNATLFMTLLSAYSTLLHQYSGQSSVVIGTPIANRNQIELEQLIGFFVNTLALHIDLSGSPSFVDLVSRVRNIALGAYAHQELPFEKLVEELKPERNLSYAPLVQVMFVLQQRNEFIKLDLPDLEIGPFRVDIDKIKFDLSLHMIEKDDGLKAILKYNTDLFTESTIDQMLDHLECLLEAVVRDPAQDITRISFLTSEEKQKILYEWNDTRVQYPSTHCLHELFDAQVKQTPHSLAISFDEDRLSYLQLNERANQLAHYLIKQGIGPDVPVGICLERSLDMVIALYGILKASGAYVPLDPSYPQERLEFMIKDAQAPLVLTSEHLIEKLPAHTGRTICLDAEQQAISQECSTNPEYKATKENLAYIIYTSGSTGVPKGVMIDHEAICNRLYWMQETFNLTEAGAVLQKTPFSFDVSVWEFFWPLMVGARLVIAQPNGHRDPHYLTEIIIKEQITTLHFVPSMLQGFLDAGNLQSCDSLCRVICSGEALSVDLQHRFFEQSNARLYNLYGPTEAAVDVTFWACQPDSTRATIPIGRPIANTQIYILNSHLEPVPIGVPGELCIGGIQVARGYLNRPQLTDEKFVPDPFCDEPSKRLYKTGDRAKYLPDGTIEFLGRVDHQVKIRGFRIELGEIETVLRSQPGVQEAVVLAREESLEHKRLVAYIVPEAGQSVTGSELQNALQQRLPSYMIPSAFVMVASFPQTSSGKIDRNALPLPDRATLEVEERFVLARSETETQLANIWSQVLRLDKVGVHDNFFQLGGDSILSIQIVSKANQAGLHLAAKDIFQYQTIAELACVADVVPMLQAEQGPVVGPVPQTPIQRWFFAQEQPNPHYWNQSMLLDVAVGVDDRLLEQAIHRLVEHHDALRLRFSPTKTGWQQVNHDITNLPSLIQVDLSTLSGTEQQEAIATTATQYQASLHLTNGPLIQPVLFQMGSGKSGRLLLAIHHLVVDGVSWRILLEDLETVYQQLQQAEVAQLPSKTTSYKAWAEQLVEHSRTSIELHQELDYWLAAVPPNVGELPIDQPTGINSVMSARTVRFSLTAEETQALLHETPKAYHTQINDLLLTALAQALAPWLQSRQLLVALEGHGREDLFEGVDLSRTVGWFTSIFPVLLDLGAEPTVGSELKTIKEQLRHIPNRGIGYGILRYLNPDDDHIVLLETQPEPKLSFNYLGQFDQALTDVALFQPARESSGLHHSPEGKRNYWLEINCKISDGRFQIDWAYSTELHNRETIEQLAEQYMTALRELIDHCCSVQAPSFTPSDFPLAALDEQEFQQLTSLIGESGERVAQP